MGRYLLAWHIQGSLEKKLDSVKPQLVQVIKGGLRHPKQNIYAMQNICKLGSSNILSTFTFEKTSKVTNKASRNHFKHQPADQELA